VNKIFKKQIKSIKNDILFRREMTQQNQEETKLPPWCLQPPLKLTGHVQPHALLMTDDLTAMAKNPSAETVCHVKHKDMPTTSPLLGNAELPVI
jgi:hypothetical protein